jgi:hypothetical protein
MTTSAGEVADEIERRVRSNGERGDRKYRQAVEEAPGHLAFVLKHRALIVRALRALDEEPSAGAVERAAAAMYADYFEGLIGCCEPAWGDLPESHRDRCRRAMRAALAAARDGAGTMESAPLDRPCDHCWTDQESCMGQAYSRCTKCGLQSDKTGSAP